MTTLDLPDRETSPTFGQPVPDPAEAPPAPPDLPEAPAQVPDGRTGLPSGPTACRWCGASTGPDSLVVGGVVRVPETDPIPSDVVSHRLVRTTTRIGNPDDGTARLDIRVSREVVVPHWRCCGSCASLPRIPGPVDYLNAALGRPVVPLPVLDHIADRHPLTPFHATRRASPRSRGNATPWAHARAALEAARELLEDLTRAGGIPSPTGLGCGICGRTHSAFGWSSRRWFPASGPAKVPAEGFALCGGWEVKPARRSRWSSPERRRIGCETLIDAPAVAGPLVERTRDRAQREGAEVIPTLHFVRPQDRGRVFAAAHPGYHRLTGEGRVPWWHLGHLADAVIPPEPDPSELADRLAAVEARLASGV